jgi:2'-5' RNA ligase
MRSFIGIFLPEEIKQDFKDLKVQLRKQKQNVDFVSAPDAHLSLRFIGNSVSENSIEEIRSALHNVISDFNKFPIILSSLELGYPGEKFPKHLNISIKPNKDLDELYWAIEKALPGKHFRDIYTPQRDWIPHITIGRLHGNIHRKKIMEVEDAVNGAIWNGKDKSFTVEKLTLIRSEKVKDEFVYHVIDEFKLK